MTKRSRKPAAAHMKELDHFDDRSRNKFAVEGAHKSGLKAVWSLKTKTGHAHHAKNHHRLIVNGETRCCDCISEQAHLGNLFHGAFNT
ncbi:hypothetical protein C8N36_12037 [Pelagimonas varians]|uniref:Uncharacterized protein n=1 Tax=Pelagimonas varians TaxID=696760 RepID=A0A238L297_9RHOB|nr:hypothetical protein C8N36_12037 [Pelagimonas varians]SMX49097.1 hypothetical protein PEV8663_04092 [Pelagimonas varians]